MPKFNHAHEASSKQSLSVLSAVAGLYIPLLYQVSHNPAHSQEIEAVDIETKDEAPSADNSFHFPQSNPAHLIGLTFPPRFKGFNSHVWRAQYV